MKVGGIRKDSDFGELGGGGGAESSGCPSSEAVLLSKYIL